jgi:hypothetical protein
MKPGDEVWVKGTVTSMTARRRTTGVAVAFRVANRVGADYAGSSGTNRLLNGQVVRSTEVPIEDIKEVGEA